MEEQETAASDSPSVVQNSETENLSEEPTVGEDLKENQLQKDAHDCNKLSNDTLPEKNSSEVLNDISNDVSEDGVRADNAKESVKNKDVLENNVDSIENLINNIDHHNYNNEADNDNDASDEIVNKPQTTDSEIDENVQPAIENEILDTNGASAESVIRNEISEEVAQNEAKSDDIIEDESDKPSEEAVEEPVENVEDIPPVTETVVENELPNVENLPDDITEEVSSIETSKTADVENIKEEDSSIETSKTANEENITEDNHPEISDVNDSIVETNLESDKDTNKPVDVPDEIKTTSDSTPMDIDEVEKDEAMKEKTVSEETKENGPKEPEKMDVDLDTANDIDERGEPAFESAPEDNTLDISNVSDTNKSFDPFDQLLSGSSSAPVTNTVQVRKEFNFNNDDDDDDMDNTGLDFDHQDSGINDQLAADDTITEEGPVTDITEGQGADEEICLLPDTEREISEADKLKALAAKTDKCGFDSLIKDSKTGEDMLESNELKREVTLDGVEKSHDETVEENDLGETQEDNEEAVEDEANRDFHDTEKEKEEEVIQEEPLLENIIQEINIVSDTCLQCSQEKQCKYRLLVESETKYICETECVIAYQEANPDKYTISYKKVYIREMKTIPKECNKCSQCSENKKCYYEILEDDNKWLCGETCLNAFIGADKEKYFVNRKKKVVHEITEKEALCHMCSETKNCTLEVQMEGETKYICENTCFQTLDNLLPGLFKIRKKRVIRVKPTPRLKVISNATDKYLDVGNKIKAKTPEQVEQARVDRERSFSRKCAQCEAPYLGNDKNLSWETMDFCNETCLGDYQNSRGSHCANCKSQVSISSLGKYCVRFGYDIRQFCRSGCLEEFKKGLKICCYCQRDISSGVEGFLAPVGDKGQFKDFCSQFCVSKFDQMSRSPVPPPIWAQCAVCSKEKPTQIEVGIDDKTSLRLCSEPCFAAFKFVNHIFPDQCRWCNKYFERKSSESYTIYADTATHCYCSKACMNVYISNSRHIVPCNWCKVKKYNFDMISRSLTNGQNMMLCSLNCLTLYQVSLNAVSAKRIKCDQCKHYSPAQYHLTMSDATVRNFCTYQCVMSFQSQYSKTPLVVEGESHTKQAVPTGAPRKYMGTRPNAKSQSAKSQSSGLPVIASVQSLAPPPLVASTPTTRGKRKQSFQDKKDEPEVPLPAPSPPPPPPPKIYNHVVIKPAPPKEVKNIGTLTKPITLSKGTSCRTFTENKECQTEDFLEKRTIIPIPVPIYVPVPVVMYSAPFPVPVPIPLPMPIPVFIPTTRNSANGIMKEIKKIHDKMPTDPLEAELLMMAEMVAGDKKKCDSDSESDDDNDTFSPEAMDTGNTAFTGEDMLQMALKMATEYEEPAVDLESAMTASTITPSSHPSITSGLDESGMQHHHLMMMEQQRAAAALALANNRKRGARTQSPATPTTNRPNKRSRRAPDPTPPPMPEPPREPVEKPDANMCLKYTFGVNAWKQWVVTKNADMEKSSSYRKKPFKSEILQLTADELNYSLCLFVKEVRKPNGSEYAPDTIYYLVLGIQQYLFENGRIDNIFTDPYYEKFTECLDEVARKFSVLYNDSQYIVTRVEEEHLWESKQLGAHSPHVLLSTLMFFNTKHFNLVTVEEHMQLSFSHIMKHWKRNPNQPGAAKIPGSRNVLLRFYPPQSALEANTRKKKVYEQQENEENPLRCPVKLYEFYLSKCPESVKTRNDVFYLMPERSCVPDSPVWYSTQALGREPLSKMLHRVKMVKEINIALLTS